jgi:hypothetical protein
MDIRLLAAAAEEEGEEIQVAAALRAVSTCVMTCVMTCNSVPASS